MPFQPTDLTTPQQPPIFSSDPQETWLPIWSHPCTFSADIFSSVILNLIENPNITSSHLFRADILSDTQLDDSSTSSSHSDTNHNPASTNHGNEGQEAPQARAIQLNGFARERTIVRRLIPRNPNADAPLLQTCLFLASTKDDDACASSEEDHTSDPKISDGSCTAIVYVPHVSDPAAVPFYHPLVRALAFVHTPSAISIHYVLFPSVPLTSRLHRTARHLLATIHKHGNGQADGYVKRVHHDLVVPRATYQDTYSRLKLAHARRLIDGWREVTDPGKHVFEDLGIAAFLIEVWTQMYGELREDRSTKDATAQDSRTLAKQRFPGFVDIGCGNGVLVDILLREGWHGWGFDARHRKSWDAFPDLVQRGDLKEMLLVPEPFMSSWSSMSSSGTEETIRSVRAMSLKSSLREGVRSAGQGDEFTPDDGGEIHNSPAGSSLESESSPTIHNGIFPPLTFIISNHADELTAWTPLLAALSNHCPFLVIPCCSYDLSGAKFRAPAAPLSSSTHPSTSEGVNSNGKGNEALTDLTSASSSAYATLVDWVARLCVDLGYEVEREMLRIPSTRNAALLGRKLRVGIAHGADSSSTSLVESTVRERDVTPSTRDDQVGPSTDTPLTVAALLERETNAKGRAGASSAEQWIERTLKLMKTQGKGREKGKRGPSDQDVSGIGT